MARKHGTPVLWEVANISKAGYFKVIKTAKNKHWSSFLLGATPHSLWTAKRFANGRAPPRFHSLPGAETPQQMNKVLLDHFFPQKEPFSPPPQTKTSQEGAPTNKGRDSSSSLQVLPDVGPSTRRDSLHHLEAGQ